MFLMIKNRCITPLFIITTLLLVGCTNATQSNASFERALNDELNRNKALFLNKPIADVFNAFQRQPSKISLIDKKNNVVWLYQIYDVLLDPQTGQSVSLPGQISFFNKKVHWKEEYYVNSDGVVYDIKIRSAP